MKSVAWLSSSIIAASLMIALAEPACAYDEGAVTGGGVVTGQVVYNGDVPTRDIIPNKDPDVCGGPRTDTLITLGPNHEVAGALVYIADVPKGKPWPPRAKPQELDNHHCRFEPDVQVIRPGQVDIVNLDPVLHNTHGYYGRRTAFNTALPNQDQRIAAELLKTGTVKVDCDAHGWMEGWIYVRDNPYYAMTDGSGKFSIADVPPGTYTLVLMQPYAGVTEQQVTVTGGQTNDLKLELKAGTPD